MGEKKKKMRKGRCSLRVRERMFRRSPGNKRRRVRRSAGREDTSSGSGTCSRSPARSVGRVFSGRRPADCAFRPFSWGALDSHGRKVGARTAVSPTVMVDCHASLRAHTPTRYFATQPPATSTSRERQKRALVTRTAKFLFFFLKSFLFFSFLFRTLVATMNNSRKSYQTDDYSFYLFFSSFRRRVIGVKTFENCRYILAREF